MPTAVSPAAPAACPLPRPPNISPCWRMTQPASRSPWSMLQKCRIEAALNLGGDQNDTVTLDKVQPLANFKPAPKGFDQTQLMALMGGVARSLQIAG